MSGFPSLSLQKALSCVGLAACLCYPGVCQKVASGTATPSSRKAASDLLRRDFLQPPAEARPMVRWWWFGPAVTRTELLRELQQMKADGVGGAELAFVYPEALDDAAKGIRNTPFLSPDMLDAVRYAQTEGRRLGLRIDVTLCSGWPYGGPATPLAEAAGRLRTLAVPLSAGTTTVPAPQLKPGETILMRFVTEGTPEKWRAETAIAVADADVTPADHERVALFFIQSHTLQQVKRAAVGAEGLVLDPFSRQAVATHLRAVGEPLIHAFGDKPPYAIFSDSLEAYGADWTPSLPEEFRKRRGYDLQPLLPEFVAGGTPAAMRVRHDYGRTLTELVNENYLSQINDWAHAHGTLFRSQTYGEPAVSLASQRLVDLPEGEGPQWRAFSTLRWATSGNHLFGNNVSSGESFTWLHSPVFRATPLDMKAEADIDFVMGENLLVLHGWPYSPPAPELPGHSATAQDPGFSLYAAGAFNDHNPWHPVMPAVMAYLTRVSWLLRQGKPANQVAVLLPTDDAWAGFAPGKVSVTEAMKNLITPGLMSAVLGAGYNVDYTDADTVQRLGLSAYEVLVLPPTDRIPAATLDRLRAFTAGGGKVVYVGRRPSLDAEGRSLPPGALPAGDLAAEEASLPAALHAACVADFALQSTDPGVRGQVGFIRRRLGTSDVYFVANTGNTPVSTGVVFASDFKHGFELDPDTGLAEGEAFTAQQLKLAPYQSRIFVFDSAEPSIGTRAVTEDTVRLDLSHDWQLSFPALSRSEAQGNLPDWTADPTTLHFSGEGVYSRDFVLPATSDKKIYLKVSGGKPLPGPVGSQSDSAAHPSASGPDGLPNPKVTRPGPGMHAFFDPPVREAAIVILNGRIAGELWHPPYRLDVTSLLRAGVNHLEIRVYNTALNAWSALPPRNYEPLKARYGDRFQMQDLDKVVPVSSGLLGSISLVTEETR